jgi:hypothetical protein
LTILEQNDSRIERNSRMTSFIDYSEAYFRQLNESDIPPLREGKFVQLKNGEDEFIVFAPKGLCKYHSDIVVRFGEIENESVAVSSRGDSAEFDDPMWKIIGGGKMRINDDGKSVDMTGASQVYGPFRKPGLADRLAAAPNLAGYRINIIE